MKKILETIRSYRTAKTYTATMIIAGHTITVPVVAKDIDAALHKAEIIADDCGFVIDVA